MARRVRPQQGFPLRLIVPGFEGIYQTKYLRRIKVVDRYYMTYNDYGHINPDPESQRAERIKLDRNRSSPFLPADSSSPAPDSTRSAAWPGPARGAVRKVEVSTDGGKSWKDAELRTPAYPMAHTRFGFHWNWDGKECVLLSRCTDELGTVQPTRAEAAKFFNKPLDDNFRVPGADNTIQPWKVASDGSVHNGLA